MVIDLEEYKAKKYGKKAKKCEDTTVDNRKIFLELRFTDAEGNEQERVFDSAMEFIRAAGRDAPDMPVDAHVEWARFNENDENQWTDTTIAELALRCKMVMGC